MIVEDDPALKADSLVFRPMQALTAEDFDSAIGQVRRHQPAVVTMDLGLPPDPDSVSEGFRLLEQILSVAPDTKGDCGDRPERSVNALKAVAMGPMISLPSRSSPSCLP